MRRIIPVILAALIAGASTAQAQSASKSPAVSKSATIDRDSVSLADVQRAADELARTVQAAVKKIKEDPELKVAALRLAKESVNATQVIVATQAETLQSLLATCPNRLSMTTLSS